MSTEANRATLAAYAKDHDPSYLAPDAVYTDMATGQEFRGREAVGAMLHWFYHVAFEAHAETVNMVVDGDRGALEGVVIGRHIGEFAGVPGTGQDVRIPISVFYEFRDGQIVTGRFYLSVPVFLSQVRSMSAAAAH
jgi:steroid delta-isomerase-like uncharacterized protein